MAGHRREFLHLANSRLSRVIYGPICHSLYRGQLISRTARMLLRKLLNSKKSERLRLKVMSSISMTGKMDYKLSCSLRLQSDEILS